MKPRTVWILVTALLIIGAFFGYRRVQQVEEERQAVQEQLNEVILSKEEQVKNYDSALNKIRTNLQDIASEQNVTVLISKRKTELEQKSTPEQIEELSKGLNDELSRRQKRVDKLRTENKALQNKFKILTETIEVMEKQIEEQRKIIERLVFETEVQQNQIGYLSQMSDSLSRSNKELNENLEREKNAIFWLAGTKSELKKNRIINSPFFASTYLAKDYGAKIQTLGQKLTWKKGGQPVIMVNHTDTIREIKPYLTHSEEYFGKEDFETVIDKKTAQIKLLNPRKFSDHSKYLILLIKD